jgi:uncharacterized protein (TIGR03435 family)
MATLANSIQLDAGRPIINKTELTGLFDFDLEYNAEPISPALLAAAGQPIPNADSTGALAASDPASLLSSALQRLGLKLESAKAPLGVLVIDTVQKPSEN